MKNLVRPVLAKFLLTTFRVNVKYSYEAANLLAAGNSIVHANHVSLLDGILVALASPRPLVFAVDTDFSRRSTTSRLGLRFLEKMGFGLVVPLDCSAPFGMRTLKRALLDGSNVMVFPEGAISPSGCRQTDKPGLCWLKEKSGARLIEVRISGAEQSKLFAKNGTHWWPRITLSF